MIDLDKLAELARAAMPGPCAPGDACTNACWRNEPACVRHERAMAAFIAAANPATVLELVERLRAAEDIVRERSTCFEHAGNVCADWCEHCRAGVIWELRAGTIE